MTIGASSYPSDRPAEAPGRVRQTVLPAGTRELSTLARIDYEDAFLVDVGLVQDGRRNNGPGKRWKPPR